MSSDRAGNGHPLPAGQQAQASPCPGAQGSVPSTAAATQGMVATFNATRATNMAVITQKASPNIELQFLLMSTISTYEAEQADAQRAGLMVSQHVVEQARKRRKVVAEAVVGEEEISPTETLRYGQHVYANWTKKLFVRALTYIDIHSMPPSFVKTLSHQVLKEVFEFGLGLRLHGENHDKATELNILNLFGLLKQFYVMNGSLWTKIQWEGTTPLWAKCGYYSVESAKCSERGVRIFVGCSQVAKPVEFTEDIYGTDPGPFDVVSQNFSLKFAHFKTAKDTYMLMNLFPVLSRTLRRRLSEEFGVASPDSGVMVPRPSSAPQSAPLSDDGPAPRSLALADVGSAAAAASPRVLPLAVERDKEDEAEVEDDKEECPATAVEDDKDCTPASGGAPARP